MLQTAIAELDHASLARIAVAHDFPDVGVDRLQESVRHQMAPSWPANRSLRSDSPVLSDAPVMVFGRTVPVYGL